jgi:hypothetical protein
MITLVVPWLGQRGLVSRGSWRERRHKRGFLPGPQPLLWLAAAGSVAFWVWQMQRRAGPAAEASPGPATERSTPGRTASSTVHFPMNAVPREANGAERWLSRGRTAALPQRSLSWVYRAQQVLRMGGPAELRQLAVEMANAGLEAEAGLLDNYALMLERSSNSRPRVVAEVARMLEAAASDRQANPALATRRPIVPMPIVPVEEQRRATG